MPTPSPTNPQESETPETTYQTYTAVAVEGSCGPSTKPLPVVTADFARSLERRLREADREMNLRLEIQHKNHVLALEEITRQATEAEKEVLKSHESIGELSNKLTAYREIARRLANDLKREGDYMVLYPSSLKALTDFEQLEKGQ